MHEVDCIYHQAFFVCASAMGLCDGFMQRLAHWLRSENINAVSRRQDSDSWTGSGTGSLQLSYRELQVLAPPICPCMADSYYHRLLDSRCRHFSVTIQLLLLHAVTKHHPQSSSSQVQILSTSMIDDLQHSGCLTTGLPNPTQGSRSIAKYSQNLSLD